MTKPVAWMHNEITGNVITHRPADIDRHPERWKPLYEAQLQLTESAIARADRAQRLEKKEWVGLTDDELSDAYNLHYERYFKDIDYVDFLLIYKAVEAKLKEKNT